MSSKILNLFRGKSYISSISLFFTGIVVFGLSYFYVLYLPSELTKNLGSQQGLTSNEQQTHPKGAVEGVKTETSGEIPISTSPSRPRNTSTPTSTPTVKSQQQSSNSSGQNNASTPSATSASTPTPIPVPTPTLTPIPVPTPTPTNDGTPFEAFGSISANNEVSVTANKPLQSCSYSYCTGSSNLSICRPGDGNISLNTCSFSIPAEAWLEYVAVQSIFGEPKELF